MDIEVPVSMVTFISQKKGGTYHAEEPVNLTSLETQTGRNCGGSAIIAIPKEQFGYISKISSWFLRESGVYVRFSGGVVWCKSGLNSQLLVASVVKQF